MLPRVRRVIDEHQKTEMIAAGAGSPTTRNSKDPRLHDQLPVLPIRPGPALARPRAHVDRCAERSGQAEDLHQRPPRRAVGRPGDASGQAQPHRRSRRAVAAAHRARGVLASPSASTRRTTAWPCTSSAGAAAWRFWTLDYIELPGDPDERGRLGRAHRAAQPPDRARQRRAAAHRGRRHRRRWPPHRGGQELRAPQAAAPLLPIFGACRTTRRCCRRASWSTSTGAASSTSGACRSTTSAPSPSSTCSTAASAPTPKSRPMRAWCASATSSRPSTSAGLVSETYNPAKNRFEKRRGAAQRTARHLGVRLRRHAPPGAAPAPRHEGRLGCA
jgi:hypothetical protein